MEVYILNRNFETMSMIDSYTSLIWTDRYYKAGDFEIYMPTSTENLAKFVPDYYLWNKDSEHLMIIEDIKTTSDIESGNNLTVTGRSLESILERRIVWNNTEFTNTSLQDAFQKLIEDNIIGTHNGAAISGFIPERKINNFIFEPSTDPAITTLTLEAQYEGDNLYEIITKVCEDKKIGFKITLNENEEFVFKLYTGTDRSYSQSTNSFVVFSPNFENIVNSEYTENKSVYRNVALVVGEGETPKRIAAGETLIPGLDRREIYYQDSNLKSNNTDAQYQEKGVEELKNYKTEKVFEGEVETSKIFIYQQDYFIGDILELEDEYGRQARTRVVEFIRNQDDSGYKAYPSFEVISD